MASDYIHAALTAAGAASDLIRERFQGSFSVDYKSDDSPVTEVDIAAERAIKAVLSERFPDHGFVGEELGREHTDAEYLWLIDPIDGTKAFVRGYPLFSVQIALMRNHPGAPDGELIAGVSHAPCLSLEQDAVGDTMWAEKGAGAWRLKHTGDAPESGRRLSISDIDTLSRATLSTGNLARLAASKSWPKLGNLITRLHRIRGYGDFLHYHWLSDGRLDAVVESDVNILDIAALSVIVHEAGGVFTDLEGRPLNLATRSVLAANRTLHPQLLTELDYHASQ